MNISKTAAHLVLSLILAGAWGHNPLQAQEPAPDTKPEAADSNAVTDTNTPSSAVVETATNGEPTETTNPAASDDSSSNRRERSPLVSIGHDVELNADDSAQMVVVIGGSAKVKGHVHQAAVVILGDLEVEGTIGQDAVAIFGNVTAGPGARINGQAVAVGGKVDAAPTAFIHGQPISVDFPKWLKKWFLQCVLKLRPLAPQVGWVWLVAGIFFLLYLLIAAVFPTPVQACVNELTRRPATTFLMGLVAKLLLPLVILILAATGIGLLVVPFILAALVLGAVLGKVALLEWLGFKVAGQFGANSTQRGAVALALGALIIALLYMVPVLGLVTFMITSVWGLGAAVTAAFGGLRREMPAKPAAPAHPVSPSGSSPQPGQAPAPFPSAASGTMAFAAGAAEGGATVTAAAPTPLTPPLLPEVLAYPRAGFWERMGAGLLDMILVGILGGLTHFPPLAFLAAVAYFTGMLTWKGTTVGGIVLGLKVVRADGQPVSIAVALVRALAAVFSIVVLFLGFLWIAWDNEKQGWHDKIAGTVVLRLPRGTPLICL